MANRPHQKPQDRRKPTGQGSRTNPNQTPVTALRLPRALLDRADELVPLLAATGEHVLVNRSTVLRLALDAGLRTLRRRFAAAE